MLATAPAAFPQDMESTVYSAANSCSALRSYLGAYPQGRYRADAEARIATDCAVPKPTPKTEPARTAAPSPSVDPCIAARADWAQLAESSDLTVLRTYLNTAPQDCQVQRAQATTRILDVETAQRQAAAKAVADQQAEADRKAAEQQRQDVLNRSWSAIAVSGWATGNLGVGYVDWGGATGQTSQQAATAAAIKACDAKGGAKNCRVAFDTFNEGCAAFAYKESDLTEGNWGVAVFKTEDVARLQALDTCGLKGCEVKLVICARPG